MSLISNTLSGHEPLPSDVAEVGDPGVACDLELCRITIILLNFISYLR